ncbi:MAG TPA: hypothetical protein V6C91_22350 [Coleofasciculaceae cyanobacterium]
MIYSTSKAAIARSNVHSERALINKTPGWTALFVLQLTKVGQIDLSFIALPLGV